MSIGVEPTSRATLNRIKAGEDPVAEPLPARLAGGPTVADLASRYMEEHVAVRCKGSTAESIRKLVNMHILPAFGRLRCWRWSASEWWRFMPG